MRGRFDAIDLAVTRWMADNGITVLRISLGIVFFWFGVLKFFPNANPAEMLAGKTIAAITFGHVQPNVSMPLLATWECLIGLGLLTRIALRATIFLLFVQIAGTLHPLFNFPQETFKSVSFVPTLQRWPCDRCDGPRR